MDPRKNETCDLSDVILNETDIGTQVCDIIEVNICQNCIFIEI